MAVIYGAAMGAPHVGWTWRTDSEAAGVILGGSNVFQNLFIRQTLHYNPVIIKNLLKIMWYLYGSPQLAEVLAVGTSIQNMNPALAFSLYFTTLAVYFFSKILTICTVLIHDIIENCKNIILIFVVVVKILN